MGRINLEACFRCSTWRYGRKFTHFLSHYPANECPALPTLLFNGIFSIALAGGFARFSQDLPCYGNSAITKTKILASLQLFCDCGLFFVPSERKGATVQPITCVFASQSAIRHPATVPNRKKIAIQADFLFWALGIGPRSAPYRRGDPAQCRFIKPPATSASYR